jgi:hypothetical protein
MRSWDLSRIIGLYGKMYTGKSTIAARIKASNPGQVVVMSFAAKLRQVLKDLHIPESRGSLQKVGQGLRNLNPDVWVDAVRPEVDESLSLGNVVVFDDLRYPNEFDYIKNLGGLLVKLSTDIDERWRRYGTSSKFDSSVTKETWLHQQGHVSETILDAESLNWNLELDTTNTTQEGLGSIADSLVISVGAVHPYDGRYR